MHLESIQFVDQAVLVLTGLVFVSNVAIAMRTVFDKAETQSASISRKFGIFRPSRLVFHIATAAWMVTQWLKMESIWEPTEKYLPYGFQQWAADGRLCRLHLTLSIGLLEPFCIFTGILLCRGILSRKGTAELHPNWRLIKAAALLTAPFTVIYSGFAWMSVMKPELAWEQSRRVGFYFLGTYRKGNMKECLGSSRVQCLQCFVPACFGITSAFVFLIAMLLLWGGLLRRYNGAIDSKKITRLLPFQICLTVAMFCLMVLRSTTVIGGSPFKWVFQTFWFWNNMAVICSTIMLCQFLITAPAWEMTADHAHTGDSGKWM